MRIFIRLGSSGSLASRMWFQYAVHPAIRLSNSSPHRGFVLKGLGRGALENNRCCSIFFSSSSAMTSLFLGFPRQCPSTSVIPTDGLSYVLTQDWPRGHALQGLRRCTSVGSQNGIRVFLTSGKKLFAMSPHHTTSTVYGRSESSSTDRSLVKAAFAFGERLDIVRSTSELAL